MRKICSVFSSSFWFSSYCRPRDTGLYYLQSRYYDPAIGRFINADSYASTGQGFLGCNMFAYCLNNPVNYLDGYGRYAMAAARTWAETMWWLSGIDGPIPVGDIIFICGLVALVLICESNKPVQIPTIYCDDSPESKKNDGATSLPTEGEPNSDDELYDNEGNLKQKRHYGPDGKAEYDIDYSHGGNHSFPHKHEWDWTQSPPRLPSKPIPMPK